MSETREQPYNLIFFDWDGTIADTMPTLHDVVGSVYREWGFDASDDVIRNNLGHWAMGALAVGASEDISGEIFEHIKERGAKALEQTELFTGARETLAQLRQARAAKQIGSVVLVTNNFVELIDPLDQYDLGQNFTMVLCNSSKPEPFTIFEGEVALFKEGGVHPRSVIVGDSPTDMALAWAAQIDSIWINHPENRAYWGPDYEKLMRSYKPTHEVRSFEELTDLLLP